MEMETHSMMIRTRIGFQTTGIVTMMEMELTKKEYDRDGDGVPDDDDKDGTPDYLDEDNT